MSNYSSKRFRVIATHKETGRKNHVSDWFPYSEKSDAEFLVNFLNDTYPYLSHTAEFES